MERLTRRVRSISQRLEAVEDALTRLEDGLRGTPSAIAGRLDAIEEQLTDATRVLAELMARRPDATAAVPPGQERLAVEGIADSNAAEPAP
jgi:non-ribosomal peptide synthetase component F